MKPMKPIGGLKYLRDRSTIALLEPDFELFKSVTGRFSAFEVSDLLAKLSQGYLKEDLLENS